MDNNSQLWSSVLWHPREFGMIPWFRSLSRISSALASFLPADKRKVDHNELDSRPLKSNLVINKYFRSDDQSDSDISQTLDRQNWTLSNLQLMIACNSIVNEFDYYHYIWDEEASMEGCPWGKTEHWGLGFEIYCERCKTKTWPLSLLVFPSSIDLPLRICYRYHYRSPVSIGYNNTLLRRMQHLCYAYTNTTCSQTSILTQVCRTMARFNLTRFRANSKHTISLHSKSQ